MKFYLFFILLNFFFNIVKSQQINGEVFEANGSPLAFGNVSFQELNSSNIQEITEIKNGKFSKKLIGKYESVLLTIRSVYYEDIKDTINFSSKDNIFNKKYVLEKKIIHELKEVILKNKEKSFKIKEDTVSYNPNNYKDGSEKKLEDILKKLPGIEVNEKSGEIKYKGKSIESLNIDGDDLFGKNYTLGTKNINLNIIDEIEGIENYSGNPLLKGLESQDKVALNIKLKKGLLDLSGNLDYADGFSELYKKVYNISTNILAINTGFKSFNTISYNNIGVNNTPFNYFSSANSLEQISDEQFYTKKIINDNLNNINLDETKINNNNLLFANHNSITKLSEKINLRINLYLLKDEINQISSLENKINENNLTFTTSDDYTTSKKPKQYKADFLVKYTPNKSTLYEYNLQLSNENIKTIYNINQNNQIDYSSKLISRSNFINNRLSFTKRLNDRTALQIKLIQSYNEIPQEIKFTPYINNLTNTNYQFSRYSKSFLNLNSNLIGITPKKNKYSLTLGTSFENIPFSSFSEGYNSFNKYFTNNLVFNKTQYYSSILYQFKFNKLKITPSLKTIYLHQKADEVSKNYILIQPLLNIAYTINNNSFISTIFDYNQNPFSEEYLFNNEIFITNRYSISNNPSLEIKKNTSLAIKYYLNNLYKQFQLNFGVTYSRSNGDFFNKVNVTENKTLIERFYLKADSEKLNFHFKIEKYLPKIQSTINFSSNTYINKFKNVLNNSDIRNVTSKNINNSFSIKTSFDSFINFNNNISHEINNYSFNKSSPIVNNSLTNDFKIIFKPFPKFNFITDAKYIVPSLNKNNTYLFIDLSSKYNLNDKLEFTILAKNVLNNKKYYQIDISDYSSSELSTNLIPRYLMVNISYTF